MKKHAIVIVAMVYLCVLLQVGYKSGLTTTLAGNKFSFAYIGLYVFPLVGLKLQRSLVSKDV